MISEGAFLKNAAVVLINMDVWRSNLSLYK